MTPHDSPDCRNPLISCLCPTKDRRRFLPETVRRFLAQDYRPKELIVVEDGDCAGELPAVIAHLEDPDFEDPDFELSYRSEEHTSELQSRENLVCRLLLEK